MGQLGKLGSAADMEALAQVLKSGCFFGRRANDEIRLSAVRALADIGSGEAAATLTRAASAARGRIGAACQKAATQIEAAQSEVETEAEQTDD